VAGNLHFGPPKGGWPDFTSKGARTLGYGDKRGVCYLAGPIRGVLGYAKRFDEAKARLVALGWDVISPVDHLRAVGEVPGHPLDDRAGLAWDIAQLVWVDAVMLIDGWACSLGARAEFAVASALGIPCWMENDWEDAHV
jgi:hypothetical protein